MRLGETNPTRPRASIGGRPLRGAPTGSIVSNWRNKANRTGTLKTVSAVSGPEALRRRFGETKPLRVFAALAAAKTGLDGRGEMGSTVGPQLWNFQVERLDVGVMASPETGWEA